MENGALNVMSSFQMQIDNNHVIIILILDYLKSLSNGDTYIYLKHLLSEYSKINSNYLLQS